MKEKTRPISLCLKEDEYAAFIVGYKNSVYRSMNAYATRLLLKKPVKVIVRNRSVDDLIELGVKLRKELRGLLVRNSLTLPEKEVLLGGIKSIEEKLIQLVEVCTRE